MNSFTISGNIVDIINRRIFTGRLIIEKGIINSIIPEENKEYDTFIMPGFVDAHVHIESSMLVPSEFARLASVHGTVATVSDPHEIANVMGVEGVKFMIGNAAATPFKFYFGVPSCVPATPFETSGANINAGDIKYLFEEYGLKYLSEMMNFPGVLNQFPEVMEKIAIAKDFGKPIDGHAPGLQGPDARKYISAGISTDHECVTLDEAIDKIYNGMKILIREGSAAKNFDALKKLIEARPDMCMLCSDDKHPDDLLNGHINKIAARAMAQGFNVFNVLQTAILNPVNHYSLDVGLLRAGDDADFIVVNNLSDFDVKKTYVKGQLIADNGKTMIQPVKTESINRFNTEKKITEDFEIPSGKGQIRVIEAFDGELFTKEILVDGLVDKGMLISDTDRDILKLAVVNRYGNTRPALAFIKNFGLKNGAMATSVAHDSHNIIAVGTNEADLCRAVNCVIESKGGMAVVNGEEETVLALPIAGIMSPDDAYKTAESYSLLDKEAKGLGSLLKAPFMTLSFMALLVIPEIKLSDKGLFDGRKFGFIDLQLNN